MTDAEWEKEERRLRAAATRAANMIRNCRCTLVAKLLLMNKRKSNRSWPDMP